MLNKLQKSIYDLLNNQTDIEFQNITGIFNYVDKNTKLPYIYFQINNVQNKSNYTTNLFLCNLSISVFDKNTSSNFIFDIMEKIKDIISNFENDIIIDSKYISSNISIDITNIIIKGEIIFDLILKEK